MVSEYVKIASFIDQLRIFDTMFIVVFNKLLFWSKLFLSVDFCFEFHHHFHRDLLSTDVNDRHMTFNLSRIF